MIKKTLDFKKHKKLNTRGYKFLFNIENKLRIHIIRKLNIEDPHWWNKFKQRDFNKLAENLKKDDMGFISIANIPEKKADEQKVETKKFIIMHELFYTNLNDLYAIIKNYWESFKDDFKTSDDKELFHRLKITRRIRNKIAHSKPVSEYELNELKTFSNFIDLYIKDYNEIDDCITIEDIYKSIFEEISSHEDKLTNLKKILNDDYYKTLIDETYWANDIFIYKNIIDEYYTLVNELNKIINEYEKTRQNVHYFSKFIGENDMKNKWNDLIKNLKIYNNEPI